MKKRLDNEAPGPIMGEMAREIRRLQLQGTELLLPDPCVLIRISSQ